MIHPTTNWRIPAITKVGLLASLTEISLVLWCEYCSGYLTDEQIIRHMRDGDMRDMPG